MSTSSNNSANTMKYVYDDGIAISYLGRVWLLFISNILSLACCLFVLFHLLFDSTLRHGLQNHVIIILLVMCLIWELTVVPWIIQVYMFELVGIQTPTFCIVWKFLDSIIYTSVAKLVAWASIERHILIFHDSWVATKVRRWFVHYTPLAFIVAYGIVLYGIITPMNSCERGFYYFVPFCGYYSCIYESTIFGIYEFLTGGLLSSTLIGFGSVFLILRVVFQKRRLQQHVNWRKHRKMTLQLLSVTSLFFILYLPPILVGTAHLLGLPSDVGMKYSIYANFFSNWIIFLFPFACINTITRFRTRIRNIFRYCCPRHGRAIAPQRAFTRTIRDSRTHRQKTTVV